MATIEARLSVDRPLDEVFRFVVDGDKVPQWRKSCIEIKRLSAGPLDAGAEEVYRMKTMGQTFEVRMEVTGYEPNREYSWKATSGSPFPMQGSFTFKGGDSHAEVTEITEIELGGPLRLVQPIIVRIFRREVRNDFTKLKDILEAEIRRDA